MTLSAGARLGPYEIQSPLGAGGMGAVYRARDTRLDRIVAVKVLREPFAANTERRVRLEREAKAISRLNHPNVCALYDVGEQDGVVFLVMEHLDGRSLADRLRKGPLPFEQALDYGIQIVDGLSAAHRAGIVHRDLKPGNVMLVKSGAKLLDFGLARLAEPGGSGGSPSEAPTADRPLTESQVIVGTLRYMAPEQLQGESADARSDIFGFGLVMYEMLCGRPAFDAEGPRELMAAILETSTPSASTLDPSVRSRIDAILRACTAKSPEDRFQSAHDVGLTLRMAKDLAGKEPADSTRWFLRSPIVAATLATFSLLSMIALVALVWSDADGPPRPAPRMRLELDVGSAPVPVSTPWGGLAISADGSMLAYHADGRIYLRPMEGKEATAIAGTEESSGVFFSPDGRWIGFASGGSLKKVSLDGGVPVVICAAPHLRGASWGPDGRIVFSSGESGVGLLQVSADGGSPRAITTLNASEYAHQWPEVLPGGGAVLFHTVSQTLRPEDRKLAVTELGSGTHRTVLDDAAHPRYLSTGYLLFARGTTLLAAPFDSEALELKGSTEHVVDRLATSGSGYAFFSVLEPETLVYLREEDESLERALVRIDRAGGTSPVASETRAYRVPRLSPDGGRLAVSIEDPVSRQRDVWALDLGPGTWRRLTSEGADYPIWSPDGTRLLFRAVREGRITLWSIAADGSGSPQALTLAASDLRGFYPKSFSPDGRWISVDSQASAGNWDIGLVSIEGEQKHFRATPSNELWGKFSPDGRWLAYQSDETGEYQVYVTSSNGDGPVWPASREGGQFPVWSRDGRELFFWNRNRELVSTKVRYDPEPNVATPEVLFAQPVAGVFDVTPDGTGFVLVQMPEEARRRLEVVTSFLEPIRRSPP